MDTCRTCKHWTAPNDSPLVPEDCHDIHGECRCDLLGDRGPNLNKLGDGAIPRPIWDATRAKLHMSLVYSPWAAAGGIIYTGPDFGCVHHEARV